MKLYFVRHGRAENREEWFRADELRPLTKEGIDRMKFAAAKMSGLELEPQAILTSPLVRARQTADLLADVLRVQVVELAALGPGFGLAHLEEALEPFADAESLVLVGHEPDFSFTVEGLIGGGRVTVKKGSLIRVDLFSLKPPRGELVWIIPPKMLVL